MFASLRHSHVSPPSRPLRAERRCVLTWISFLLALLLTLPLSLQIRAGESAAAPSSDADPSAAHLSSGVSSIQDSTDDLDAARAKSAASLLLNPEAAARFQEQNTVDLSSMQLHAGSVLLRRLFLRDSAQAPEDLAVLDADRNFDPTTCTQLMSALVQSEAIEKGRSKLSQKRFVDWPDLTDIYEMGKPVLNLDYADEVSTADLLNGMLLTHAHDAARVLTRNVSDSYSAYVDVLNERAKALEMQNTQFRNPSGLEDKAASTTLRDLAKLFTAAVLREDLRGILAARQYKSSDADWLSCQASYGETEKRLQETLGLDESPLTGGLDAYNPADDSYTFLSYHQDGESLLLILSHGASSQEAALEDHLRLYASLLEPLPDVRLLEAGSLIAEIPLTDAAFNGRDISRLPVVLSQDARIPLNRFSDLNRYQLERSFPNSLRAPLPTGTEIGYVRICDRAQGTGSGAEIYRETFVLGKPLDVSSAAKRGQALRYLIAALLSAGILLALILLILRRGKPVHISTYDDLSGTNPDETRPARGMPPFSAPERVESTRHTSDDPPSE